MATCNGQNKVMFFDGKEGREDPVARISSFYKAIRRLRETRSAIPFSSPRNLDDARTLKMYGIPDKFD